MALSEFEEKKCEKIMRQYVEKHRPSAHLRDKVDLSFRIKGQSVEIFEIRPLWNNPSKKIEEAVANVCPAVTQFSPVPYYLYCHSIELSLKAFLIAKRGIKKDDLKKIGHDLERCFAEAKNDGLDSFVKLTPREENELSKANKYYDEKNKLKGFEYFVIIKAVKGMPDLPDLEILKDIASKLVACIKNVCH